MAKHNIDPSKVAQALRTYLKENHGIDLPPATAANEAAKLLGFRNEHVAAALARKGHLVADLPATPRETATGTRTTISFLDPQGTLIEKEDHPCPAAAAAAVAEFVRLSADENWKAEGAERPGPAAYTVLIDYQNGGACRSFPAPIATAASTTRPQLLCGTMRDWRLTDGDDGTRLSEKQRAPWPWSVEGGGYGGLYLEFTRPSGEACGIGIEIDQGHLKVLTYSDGLGDADAIIRVTEDHTHITGMYAPKGSIPGVRIDDGGIQRAGDTVPPAFVA